MMNDLPREKLKYLIGQYGRSLAEDPKRCEALLRDFCGQYRKEINVLVSAIKESVPADLSNSQNRVPSTLLLAQLTKRLEDYLAIDREAARWTVESWAIALGLISEGARNVVEVTINSQPDESIASVLISESNVNVVEAASNPQPDESIASVLISEAASNPQPDKSVVIDQIVPPNSNIRLFTQNQVIFATFFGDLLAGATLIALNYKRTGQKAKAKGCFIIGLIPNIIIGLLIFTTSWDFVVNLSIVTRVPSLLLYIYIAQTWYKKSQSILFKQHLLNGGKKGSWWSVLGTIILSAILIFPLLNLPILVWSMIAGDKF
jgi:hypothetical protein